MIKIDVLVGIHHLKLSANSNHQLVDDVVLSNDPEVLNSIFKNKSIKEVIGLNEIKSLHDNETFLHVKTSFDVGIDEFDEKNYLINMLLMVELMCMSFWMIKDNSIKSELSHIICETGNAFKIHSNFWNAPYSNCLGKNEDVTFSEDELLLSFSIFPSIFEALHAKEDFDRSIKLTSETNRLGRAFYFLQSARASEDIGTKMAHYCTVFESLFSISNSELKHRLSETVALFLSVSKDDRVKIYRTLQNAYDIRSSIVHGDAISSKYLKNNFTLLKETIKDTDDYIRGCFMKIVNSNDLMKLFTKEPKEKIIEFVQNLIFE
ncbi:MAG: HEPN domain-containing protein [Ferruginibacter sp.]